MIMGYGSPLRLKYSSWGNQNLNDLKNKKLDLENTDHLKILRSTRWIQNICQFDCVMILAKLVRPKKVRFLNHLRLFDLTEF